MKNTNTPVCIGTWNAPEACRLCPFTTECQELKTKNCFGHYKTKNCFGHYNKSANCHICIRLESCRMKTTKNIAARSAEKIPVEALSGVLRHAGLLLREPASLMQNLSNSQISIAGKQYNCAEVLRALVDGSGNFEAGSESSPSKIAPMPPAPLDCAVKPAWTESDYCSGKVYCEACRQSRQFRVNRARDFTLPNGDIDFNCIWRGRASDDMGADELLDYEDEFANCWKAKKETKKEPKKEASNEVICINNAGMEDRFDIGVSYLFERHRSDDTMLWVVDKLGEKRECFKERFQVPCPSEQKEEDWRYEEEDRMVEDIPF
jgi:hypothetical protein